MKWDCNSGTSMELNEAR